MASPLTPGGRGGPARPGGRLRAGEGVGTRPPSPRHTPAQLLSMGAAVPRPGPGPSPLDQHDLSGGQLSPCGSLGGRRHPGPVTRKETEAGAGVSCPGPHRPLGTPGLSGGSTASPAAHAAAGSPSVSPPWPRAHRLVLATGHWPPGPGAPPWPPSLLPLASGLRVHARSEASGGCSLSWQAGALEVLPPLLAPRQPARGSNDRTTGFCGGGGPSSISSSSL